MLGYALLLLIAGSTVVVGSIVVGVAVWGWKQEAKKALLAQQQAKLSSENGASTIS